MEHPKPYFPEEPRSKRAKKRSTTCPFCEKDHYSERICDEPECLERAKKQAEEIVPMELDQGAIFSKHSGKMYACGGGRRIIRDWHSFH